MTGRPAFLRSLGTYNISAAPTSLGGAAGAQKLNFAMQPQTETQWCWAAVSTSVSLFFSATSSWTQCKVANSAWSRNDCCGSGSSGPCNKPWYLDRALTIVSVLKSWKQGIESFSSTQKQVGLGNPLCIRVGWRLAEVIFCRSSVGWSRQLDKNTMMSTIRFTALNEFQSLS